MGNRISETRDGVPFSYSYDDNNKLTSLSGGGKSAGFGYDGNGSMTSVSGDMFGTWSLVYNDANRPTSIAYPAGADTYVYNAFGQRTRASLSGSVFRYVYNGDRVLEQTDDLGNLLARYATAGASYYEPLLEFEFPDGSQRYPLYDMVGTARRLADASGTVTDGYSFDAFGRWLGGWGSTESPHDYGAAWGYLRDYSGMQQLGARFYWPEVGRFVQQDPARDGTNWYEYAGGNPVTYLDPEGLWEKCVPVDVHQETASREYWGPWHQTTVSVSGNVPVTPMDPVVPAVGSTRTIRVRVKWRVITTAGYVTEKCVEITCPTVPPIIVTRYRPFNATARIPVAVERTVSETRWSGGFSWPGGSVMFSR